MICKICKKEFSPNKYHPYQEVCSSPKCQHIRQILNERDWRINNPEYFKCRDQDGAWRNYRREYTREWRRAHNKYLKEYERSHAEQRREYMREYMRRYRAARGKSKLR